MENSDNSYLVAKKYIQNENGDIFKVMPSHYLKLSPWEDGEDRRVYESEIGNYNVIQYKNACMIINRQFNDKVEKWEHNGKKYIANSLSNNRNIAEHSYMLSTLPNHKIFIKEVNKVLNMSPNSTVSIQSEDGMSELKMVKHKGKIYYIMIINEYLPRVKAYNLFGEFCQWCNIGNCKPIFCETDNKYI